MCPLCPQHGDQAVGGGENGMRWGWGFYWLWRHAKGWDYILRATLSIEAIEERQVEKIFLGEVCSPTPEPVPILQARSTAAVLPEPSGAICAASESFSPSANAQTSKWGFISTLTCQVLYCLVLLSRRLNPRSIKLSRNGNATKINWKGEDMKIGRSRQIVSDYRGGEDLLLSREEVSILIVVCIFSLNVLSGNGQKEPVVCDWSFSALRFTVESTLQAGIWFGCDSGQGKTSAMCLSFCCDPWWCPHDNCFSEKWNLLVHYQVLCNGQTSSQYMTHRFQLSAECVGTDLWVFTGDSHRCTRDPHRMLT